jgi:hypothetical protein
MKKLSLGDPIRFTEVKWLLCGFCMGASFWIGHTPRNIDFRYYPVGAAIEFLFGREFQESFFEIFLLVTRKHNFWCRGCE